MLTEKVKTAINKYNMLKKGDTVYVGFSGGADSTALLSALLELSEELDITVHALHVNHQLRGEESDRDENFCRDLCEKLNVPLDVCSADIKRYAKANKIGIEEAAREYRYTAYMAAISDGTCKVATAHTVNDNAETIIFNLCRGTGLKGLTGIPPVRDDIIRPLILCGREEVLEYLREKGMDYVTDSTNLTGDYARNRIRHAVIPVLNEINGGFLSNITNSTEILLAENEYLDKLAGQYKDSDLRGLDGVLRRRVIMMKLKSFMRKFTAQTVRLAERAVLSGEGMSGGGISCGGTSCRGRRVNIKKNLYAKSENGRIEFFYDEGYKKAIFEPVPAKIGENLFLGDRIVSISEKNYENLKLLDNVHKNLTNNLIDYDKIRGEIFLRNRLDGDKYIRAGNTFHSRLKKLFNESIPRDKRDYTAILCDSEGIVWVEGFGAADRVKPDEYTKRVLRITT